MATIKEVLSLALQTHQSGQLQQAVELYQQILAQDPNQFVAWHNLGLAAYQTGRPDLAADCVGRAIQLVPQWAEAHSTLGSAHQALGKLDEAIASFQRAIELRPDFAKAHYNLGNAFRLLDRVGKAADYYRRATKLKPNYAEAHNNLGLVLRDESQLQEAIACIRRAVELRPDYAEAYNNLGTAYKDDEQLEEAEACSRRTLELRPESAEALSNLGATRKDQGFFGEAVELHRRALALKPQDASMYANLGLALQAQGAFDEAAGCCERALELAPESPYVHWCRSTLLLLRGDLERGWVEHEWRLRCPEWLRHCKERPVERFDRPFWKGEPVVGKTVLLCAGQGFGDTLQFIRYVPLVKKRGATMILECQKPLARLIENCLGVDRLVGRGDELPAFDVHASLMSLPAIFNTTLGSIPAETPYLDADAELVEAWRERLNDVRGFRIGVNWRGRAGQGVFRQRDIPLEYIVALAEVPGVRLISLQKGEGRQELAGVMGRAHPTAGEVGKVQPTVIDLGEDVDTVQGAFMDTAAIMKNLDLVITSDTSIPHLAGALGAPVWLALPYVPDWRWLLGRSDSLWYPTMRLFRQKQPGDWAGVFEEIQIALCELVERR